MFFVFFLNTLAATLPEKLCQTENIAPGTVANGKAAKCSAASEVASPEFCMPTSIEIAVRRAGSSPNRLANR